MVTYYTPKVMYVMQNLLALISVRYTVHAPCSHPYTCQHNSTDAPTCKCAPTCSCSHPPLMLPHPLLISPCSCSLTPSQYTLLAGLFGTKSSYLPKGGQTEVFVCVCYDS